MFIVTTANWWLLARTALSPVTWVIEAKTDRVLVLPLVSERVVTEVQVGAAVGFIVSERKAAAVCVMPVTSRS